MKRPARTPATLRDVGEFGFIDILRRKFGGRPRTGEQGIGDDAAVLSLSAGRRAVVSTDLLVEGTHFDLRWFRPEELGRRALAANLSDLAAMGVVPHSYFVAFCARPDTEVDFLLRLFAGMDAASRDSGMRLMGGDTCRGERLTLSLAVVGETGRGRVLARRGARPGDFLFVTGAPGWSYLGLRLLAGGRPDRPSGWKARAMRAHLTPVARWREGIAAAKSRAVAAMIDVSDGVLPDLRHLLEADALGAALDESMFRYGAAFRAAAAAVGVDPLSAFLAGGEDYELLMAVRPRDLSRFFAAARIFPAGVFPLGIVTRDPGVRVRRASGEWLAEDRLPKGFSHFVALAPP